MTDLTDPTKLTIVLRMLSANDTTTVKKGEKLLKPFLKQAVCTEHLLVQIANSPEVPVRHHASLLLKKKMVLFYGKIAPIQRTDLKVRLLSMMIAEPEKAVRTALAGAVATLAKAVFSHNDQWPELFSSLMQLSQDPNETMRSLNYSLLAQLVEQVAPHLKAHMVTLAQMFEMGCQDASSKVAEAALSATACFIKELGSEGEIMTMGRVVSSMLAVMGKCLQNGSEDTVVEGLDVIQECCALDQPLVNDHLEPIIHFVMGILQSKGEYDSAVTQSAGQTLINIIEFRPKLLAKKNLVTPVLSALMDMIAKEDSAAAGSLFSFSNRDGVLADGDDENDEDYSPEMDVQRLAQTIIDCLALNIPAKHFVSVALSMVAQGMGSADANMRKAGCAVLGVIAEGCADQIRENLAEILPRLLALVQDPEYYVRECACFALGQFSEHCQPDILHYNQTVLPVIFSALDDPRPTVQGTSCYVLEYFCESLQPETLRPYLNPLMNRLAALLQSPQKNIQEMALTAIAATAVAAEVEFLPYTETVCNILGQLIFNTEPAMFGVRGRALECLGHVAVAIGGDNFAHYFESGMQSAIQGTKLEDETLKEHSFVFVANAAKVMTTKFESYMPTLVPFLLEVVSESELVQLVGEEDDDDEDEDGAGGLGDYRVNVEEGFVNSKKAALTALGALAEHTKQCFAPFLGDTLQALLTEDIGSICSMHDVVRAEALSILQYMVGVATASSGITEKPKFGEVLTLNEATRDVSQAVMRAYVGTLTTDDEKMPVAYACEGLCGVLKKLGLVALQLTDSDSKPIAPKLMDSVLQILAEKAPCQSTVQHDDADDEEDDDHHDNLVMDSITDVVGELAKVMGPNYVPYFDEFHKHLIRFTKATRSHTDRSMAIGCYGEVVGEIGPAAAKYADILLPMVQAGMSDPMEGVRRNAAFSAGMLVQSTGTTLVPQFMNILQWLHPLCVRRSAQQSDTGGADVDNALAAVARLINAAPTAVPIAQVLPVIVAALPLREDITEGPCLYQCLATLLATNDATAVGMADSLVACFGETLLTTSKAMDETKLIAVTALKQLAATPQYQAMVNSYIAQLPDDENKLRIQQAMAV